MNKPRLSIILPVYNTSKYLKKCLDSILSSTFKDYELIVINDGSPDNSKEIILEYTKLFGEKLKYIYKENTGLSDTRNKGMSLAQGEYISFVDSDDYISSEMYEEMFKKLKEDDFDIVACDIMLVYEESKRQKHISSGYINDLTDKEDIKESMIIQYPAVWNKIYKKQILENQLFTKGVWYEDMEFTLKLYPKVNKIGVVRKPLYYYLQRVNSITYTYNEKLYDIISNMNRTVEEYKQYNLFDIYKDELEYLYARYALATFLKRLAKSKDKIKYTQGVCYALDSVKANFPNYKNNRYMKKQGIKGWYISHFNRLLANINYIVQKYK